MQIFIYIFSLSFLINSPEKNYNDDFLIGCNKPKGKKMKIICSSSSLKDLILHYHTYYIDENNGESLYGKTKINFTITKAGYIENVYYFDYDNEDFSKSVITIINNLNIDLKKYNIRIKPAVSNTTGEPIDFEYGLYFNSYKG